MEKTRKEVKTEATNNGTDDPFRRLPNELLLSIFSRLSSDLKCLCRCSVVSKHFANVISGVPTVSVTLSGSETYTSEFLESLGIFLHGLGDSEVERIPEFMESLSLPNLKLPKFLQKLRELESIYLEYAYPPNTVDSPFPMGKMKFLDNSVKIESFVGLLPCGPIRKHTEDELDHQHDDDYIIEEGKGVMKGHWLKFYGRYLEWICLILMLTRSHTSLRRMTIVDSKVHGKLVIGDEKLANFEYRVFVDEFMNQLTRNIVRIAALPVLHLPLSGYVMRWVSLAIIYAPAEDPCTSSKKLEEIVFWDSDEDEFKVLREAVKEVLKNHRDMIGDIQN